MIPLRYLLFGGQHHLEGGGWKDFVGSFNTIDEAQDACTSKHEWAHVVDLMAGTMVAEAYRRDCGGNWVEVRTEP